MVRQSALLIGLILVGSLALAVVSQLFGYAYGSEWRVRTRLKTIGAGRRYKAISVILVLSYAGLLAGAFLPPLFPVHFWAVWIFGYGLFLVSPLLCRLVPGTQTARTAVYAQAKRRGSRWPNFVVNVIMLVAYVAVVGLTLLLSSAPTMFATVTGCPIHSWFGARAPSAFIGRTRRQRGSRVARAMFGDTSVPETAAS